MNNDSKLIPGLMCLKDYEVCFLSHEDIEQIKTGYYSDTYLPIPIDKKYFEILGFKMARDRFGKGFYFKGFGLNIWYSKEQECYYVLRKRTYHFFPCLHALQYFLETMFFGEAVECTCFYRLVDPINNYYKSERELVKEGFGKTH